MESEQILQPMNSQQAKGLPGMRQAENLTAGSIVKKSRDASEVFCGMPRGR